MFETSVAEISKAGRNFYNKLEKFIVSDICVFQLVWCIGETWMILGNE
jgi:hypothetical protein